jgi:hypothetical protein
LLGETLKVAVSGKSSAEQDWMVEKRMVEKVMVDKGLKAKEKEIKGNLMLLMTKKESMTVDMRNRMVTGDKEKYRMNMDNNCRN